MSDFTPIESQEQLNAIIGERISRAEQKAAEKYADYDDLKKQNAEFQQQLQAQTEKIKGHKAEIDSLNEKVRSYESSSLKTRIALEVGLPYKMAERLTGNDEDTIRKDAEMMKSLIGAQKPIVPIGSNDPVITTNSKDNAWHELASNLFTND